MRPVLVDSNVFLDIVTTDPVWLDWSARSLEEAANHARLVINPLIYAEISIAFSRIEELDEFLKTL